MRLEELLTLKDKCHQEIKSGNINQALDILKRIDLLESCISPNFQTRFLLTHLDLQMKRLDRDCKLSSV